MERLRRSCIPRASLPGSRRSRDGALISAWRRRLRELHDVDPASVGLATLGAREVISDVKSGSGPVSMNWCDGETRRMSTAFIESPPRHIPADDVARICHGDFWIGHRSFILSRRGSWACSTGEPQDAGHPSADLAFEHVVLDHRSGRIWRVPWPRPRGLGIPERDADVERYSTSR